MTIPAQLIQTAPRLPRVLCEAASVSAGSGLLAHYPALLGQVLQLDQGWTALIQGWAHRHYTATAADCAIRRICSAAAQVQRGTLSLHTAAQVAQVAPRRRRVDFSVAIQLEAASTEPPSPTQPAVPDAVSWDLGVLLPRALGALSDISGSTPTPSALSAIYSLWPDVKGVLLAHGLRLPRTAFGELGDGCPLHLPTPTFLAIRRLLVGTRPDARTHPTPSVLVAFARQLWQENPELVARHVADCVRADPTVGALDPRRREVVVRSHSRQLLATRSSLTRSAPLSLAG